ncbi:hypothetical protein KEM60_01716 [Austwickia sp. TVS 96-490-7B]|uniref:SGNH/GDSL hydrolase family protein n=1 Tax=Austwickia sp. TVS 96-490-7B TaxID=2830843 RepID=UPI001C58D0FE|nr:SGNH/GDSL hydrolase family protein [Austwickia sp. TVS 96-490-7B]MBW3085516.1 hypothetical protein [Austwickia sp. TVS 96-490-7B]
MSPTLPHPPHTPWQRYVAIGDSFTEGMCDTHPDHDDEYIGWADRLAALLHQVAAREGHQLDYANLAVRGRLLTDITDRQLPAALALEPDLVSLVGGGNDILRPNADMDALAHQLDHAVRTIRATGADVILATSTDTRGAPLLRHVRQRHALHTANIWTIARTHGCHVIDQWGMRPLQDLRMWAPDRIHMTPEGHRRVALAAFAALGYTPDDPDWDVPLPAAAPETWTTQLRADREWARVHVGPWVHRRLTGRSSGDTRTAKRPQATPYQD